MQPLPFTDVALPSPYALLIGLLFISSFIFVALSIIAIVKSEQKKKRSLHAISWVFVALAFGAGISASVMNLTLSPSASEEYQADIDARNDLIQPQIKSLYGLDVTADQIRELEYPTEKPKEDFKLYGSFDEVKKTEGANFEKKTVYLVWSDGSLQLSQSDDGEVFTEIPTAE